MAVKQNHIKSCPHDDCAKPWIDISDLKVQAGGIEVTIAKCTGPAAADWVRADKAKERALEKKHTFTYDPEALNEFGETEMHVLAITTEGELIFVPASKQPSILYAHLAFVYKDTGDVIMNVFDPEPEESKH